MVLQHCLNLLQIHAMTCRHAQCICRVACIHSMQRHASHACHTWTAQRLKQMLQQLPGPQLARHARSRSADVVWEGLQHAWRCQPWAEAPTIDFDLQIQTAVHMQQPLIIDCAHVASQEADDSSCWRCVAMSEQNCFFVSLSQESWRQLHKLALCCSYIPAPCLPRLVHGLAEEQGGRAHPHPCC